MRNKVAAKHNLHEVRNEYERIDELLGIDTSKVKLEVSTRAVYQLGACAFRRNSDNEISITIRLSDFLFNEDEGFGDVIRHEYAHVANALINGITKGHGKEWKELCLKIGAIPRATLKKAYPLQSKRIAEHKKRKKRLLFKKR